MDGSGDRLLPVPTPLTAPYWSACRQGVLAIQRCAACRRFVHFPESVCPFCRGTVLGFEPVSGRGHVVTYTVVHRPFAPGFADQVPYAAAWVELAEQPGLRAFGRVRGCPPGEVAIGMAVRTTFTDLPGFGPIPDFRPEESDG
ncbi:Zn-ribbon domain-containing OB-fold protein [Nocardiopsis mangrovi]|uniref:Zn-ribbon domain-containing OB-fold protein n=1 Tax=Nocardiopsis mangrovi TaxID=1179818 RepID=A0ABV9E3B8_9ACTN